MDIQRIVLIAGLLVVSYLMILAWNEDYMQPETNHSKQTPVIHTHSTPTVQPIDTMATSNDIPEDVPIVNEPTTEDTPVIEELVQVNKDQIVTVVTDTMIVEIDKRGGDIVSMALKDYPLSAQTPDQPFMMLQQDSVRTYVVKSGLIGKHGIDKTEPRPLYNTDSNQYQFTENQDTLTVSLTYAKDGLLVTKNFVFNRTSHHININYELTNQSTETLNFMLYGQIKRDRSPDPSAGFMKNTYLGPAVQTNTEKYQKISFSDIDDDGKFEEKVTGGWVAMIQHYFVSAWIPNPQQTNILQVRKSSNGQFILAEFVGPSVNVQPNETANLSADFYAGPKIQQDLAQLSEGLELTVDYGWLWFLSKPLFWLLDTIHSFVGNWGIAIILLTILIKIAFLHLSTKSYRSMANMRRLQPKLKQLRERYGSDRQKMSMEMMAFYRKEKINPLGGCLPVIVQIPVFIALYWVLMESVELRQAPFFGWIQDLSLKDPYFILPILMGGSMFLQTALSPSPPDPIQARVMKMMPIFFTLIFLWFPAGLVLYWLINNIFSLVHQQYINRTTDAKAEKQKKLKK